MPKKQLAITKFEGGLVTEYDKRDLPTGASPRMRGALVERQGQVRTMGQPQEVQELSSDLIGTMDYQATPGYGLHVFGADYAINSYDSYWGHEIPIIETTNPTGTIMQFSFGLKHGLGVGNRFQWVGDSSTSNALGRVVTVTKVVNDYKVEVDFGEAVAINPTFIDSASTTVSGSVDAEENVITLVDASSFNVGDAFAIDQDNNGADTEDEYALITAITGNVCTVVRGFGATAATSILSGRSVYRILPPVHSFIKSDYISNQRKFLTLQNEEKIGVIADAGLRRDVISLGTDTTNVRPAFYSNNGTLRVHDSNLNNTNNSRQQYRFHHPQEFFHYEDPNLFSAEFVVSTATSNKAVVSNASVDGTLENDADSLEYNFTCTQSNGGFGLVVSESMGSVEAGEIYTVTFDLTVTAGYPPVIYFGNTTTNKVYDELLTGKRLSHVYPSYEGENCVVIKIQEASNGASDTRLSFWTENGDTNYTVSNLRIRKGRSGIERGWFVNSSSIAAPTLGTLEEGSDVNANPTNAMDLTLALTPDGAGGTGDWYFDSVHRQTVWGYSYVYDKFEHAQTPQKQGQESRIFRMMGSLDGQNAGTESDKMLGQVMMHTDLSTMNPRIVGARIYMVAFGSGDSAPEEQQDALWFADVDFRKTEGLTLFNGDKVLWAMDGSSQHSICTFSVSEVPAIGYSTIQQGFVNENTKTLDAEFKTSAVVHGRVYAGNVSHDTNGDGSLEYYNDRILASPPFRYDTFPSDLSLDTAQDGEDIVHMESFGSKLLVFKQTKLYIIHIPSEIAQAETVEGEHEGLGVNQPGYVIKSPDGIVWANGSGCWSYNGERIVNLIAGKLNRANWEEFTNKDGAYMGYSQVDKMYIAVQTDTAYIYDSELDNWSTTYFQDGPIISNFVQWKEDSGAIYLKSSNLGGMEELTVHTTVAPVEPVKATGSFSFTGGRLSSAILKYLDAEGEEHAISHALTTDSEPLTPNILAAGIAASVNIHSSDFGCEATNDAYYGEGIDPDTGDDLTESLVALVSLMASNFGTNFNSNTTGLGSIFFNNSGETDDLTGMIVEDAMSGGINPVPRELTVIPTRNNNTAAGIIYAILIYFPGNVFTSRYVTSYNDTAAIIATNLSNSFSALFEPGVSITEYATITDNNGSFTITAKPINPSDPVQTNVWTAGHHNLQAWSGTVSGYTDATFKTFKPSIPAPVSIFEYATKDFDLGLPGVRKKIYKVYVTYRCNAGSNVTVEFFTDGKSFNSANAKTFDPSTSTNYSYSTLNHSFNEWAIAELLPTSTGDMNDIYSLGIKFRNTGVVPSSFAINDITFIYRVKSVK